MRTSIADDRLWRLRRFWLAFRYGAVPIHEVLAKAGHLKKADQLSEAAYRNIMVQSSGKVVVAGTAKGPDGNDDFYLAQ